MKTAHKIVLLTLLLAIMPVAAASQSANGKANKRPAVSTPSPTPDPEVSLEKHNERPARTSSKPTKVAASGTPVYFYTFDRPGFVYSHIEIEHDEAGKGKISFRKTSFDEPIVDPIALSPLTMTKIKDAFSELNFLDSTEEYQYERDYSHMGNIEIRVKRDGRERTAKFNWTDNKYAKVLMDEYRGISSEYTWRFEMITARENQPLLTPGLMDALDSHLGRKEISDPKHLLPFLTELSNDERLPLMARNHVARIIKQIGKDKK